MGVLRDCLPWRKQDHHLLTTGEAGQVKHVPHRRAPDFRTGNLQAEDIITNCQEYKLSEK